MRFYRLYEALKSFHALCGLREEVDWSREIESVQLLLVLDDDGGVVRLPLQPDDLGMAAFAVDDDLRRDGFVVLMQLVAGADTVL